MLNSSYGFDVQVFHENMETFSDQIKIKILLLQFNLNIFGLHIFFCKKTYVVIGICRNFQFMGIFSLVQACII